MSKIKDANEHAIYNKYGHVITKNTGTIDPGGYRPDETGEFTIYPNTGNTSVINLQSPNIISGNINTQNILGQVSPISLEKKATGIKHDSEKPDMSLLSNTALVKIAQVMTFGKEKYSAHNWRGGFIWSRPLAAAARHLYAYIGGENKDPETGLSHLAHACCCLFMVLEFEDTKSELDDRYKEPK